MTQKHPWTEGPWKCDRAPVFGEWFVRQDPADWNGMGHQLICSLPADSKGTHYGDMFAANACLIAAAPKLAQAAEPLVAEIAEYAPSAGEDDDELVPVRLGDLKALRAALRSARPEGEER